MAGGLRAATTAAPAEYSRVQSRMYYGKTRLYYRVMARTYGTALGAACAPVHCGRDPQRELTRTYTRA